MHMIQSQEQPENGQYNNIYKIQVYLNDFSQNSGYVYDRRRVVLYNCCDSWTFFVADLGLVEISLDDQRSIEWQINQLYARPKFNQEYSSGCQLWSGSQFSMWDTKGRV